MKGNTLRMAGGRPEGTGAFASSGEGGRWWNRRRVAWEIGVEGGKAVGEGTR